MTGESKRKILEMVEKNAVEAVSYTHLDVYKRQCLALPAVFGEIGMKTMKFCTGILQP